jgi:hypothetical protein
VRLVFVTKEGNVTNRDEAGHVATTPIAPCDVADGRTTVAVSVEGHLIVGWTDLDPTSNKKLLKLMRHGVNCQ